MLFLFFFSFSVVFFLYGFEPLDCGGGVYPLVDFGCSHGFDVDSSEDSFADLAYLRFGGVIRSQVGFLAKFGLWSLRVMNASSLAVLSSLHRLYPVSL